MVKTNARYWHMLRAFAELVFGKPPKPGRMLDPRSEDSTRSYQTSGLTPSRLVNILRAADTGDLAPAMSLFEEMEEKDPHVQSVANTRRLALTGLEWQITPDSSSTASLSLAQAAADHCRAVLNRIDNFDEALQHLSLATGRNISVAEIVWDIREGSLTPVQLAPVDFNRLTLDDFDRPRILTPEDSTNGIELPPNKFIVHTPHSVTGHPQRGGLLRCTALTYLAKNLALKDWMIFSEIFGMPIRVATYQPGASAEEKRELLAMLETLGSNAIGIFSKAVELQLIDAKQNAGASPYERLIDFLNRETSKAWLGQTLTTDISGQRGSLTASQVHEQVRNDILKDDARKEGRTIRRDLLTPIVRFEFGDDAPIPHFQRKFRQTNSTVELAEMLDRAVNQLGMQIQEDWARDALGLPAAETTGRTLPGAARPQKAPTDTPSL